MLMIFTKESIEIIQSLWKGKESQIKTDKLRK